MVYRCLPFHSVHSLGKLPSLVATFADVSRLGGQLDLAEHRILLHQIEERAQSVDIVESMGHPGRQVEPELVDVHFEHPK